MAILNQGSKASTVPRLLGTVPFEGDACIHVEACSYEDELALRGWLRHTRQLNDLAIVLGRLLDDMDTCDEERAA
jgi:hypothetical protein